MMSSTLLAGVLALSLSASAAVPSVKEGQVQVHADDLPLEVALSGDTHGWRTVDRLEVNEGTGPFWLRTQVEVPAREAGAPTPALALSMLGSWEAWWDGSPLGRNGQVGRTSAEEVPGRIDAQLPLPPELSAPGPHVLTMRVSAHRLGFQPVGTLHRVQVGEAVALAQTRMFGLLPALCSLGALVLMGLYHLARVRLTRDALATLLLGVLCLCAATLVLLEAWRGIANYLYPLHPVRLRLLAGTVLAVAALLPATVHAAFGEPRRWLRWMGLGFGLLSLAFVPGFDNKQGVALGTSLVVSALLVVRARRRGEPGAWGALAGLVFSVALYLFEPWGFSDRGFFLAFGGLLLWLTVVHAQQQRRQQERLESATRAAERLQLELLKRSLQPHFLMNTLGALSEWVETQPAQAVRFIEALGTVYRHLLAVSGERTIPLSRELELCRAHLDVMGCRQGTAFRLKTEGVDLDAPVPPALLHTLLENAFSHNRYVSPHTFRLQGSLVTEGAQPRRHYAFLAPLGTGKGPGGGDGTGSRYLRARLEEAFPGAWGLQDGPTEEGWMTRVEVPA
ncbi:Sensor protein lytS [Myxococcus stipitatus DSM 14675]|uniref:Sensor protein lytS n=1 Tax=Myxococcus stipitatus (strain DSM 14675 / JCM 12634 / Mx s8) TaxID=1278073 RepID=L7U5C3_MYXSD|nr:histidine kinase [Myxococcus stipitatus]AGC44051.1 Sensor protein lytS [Myxococcus stipitatus DSM 14675]